jgi:5-methylcytosine-specific restriction protein A
LVTGRGRRFCDLHQKEEWKRQDAQRGSPAERGYGRNWRRIRGMYLRRHPWCEDPFGIHEDPVPATEVDHIIPIRAGGTNQFENLQALCKSCHSRKTVREDGGFGG